MLALAVVLVLAVGRVLTLGSDATDPDVALDTAAQAGADPSGQPSATSSKSAKAPAKPKKTKKPPTPTPLAAPSGPCAAADVLITPTVPKPVAGSSITVMLNLQTRTAEACTWQVSAETVTLNITSGADDIWSSRECPKSVPTRDVVVRRVVATEVPVLWSSRRSDEYCTARTAWALPGFYHVAAAARGGEPTDVQFKLVAPVAPVVTQTAEPTQAPGKGKGKKNKNKPSD